MSGTPSHRTMKEMLRSYVGDRQSDWDQHLSALEFAVNSSVQASTGFTPFRLNSGQEARMPIDHVTQAVRDCSNQGASDRIQRLGNDLAKAKEHLLKAQQRQVKCADQHRRHVTLTFASLIRL